MSKNTVVFVLVAAFIGGLVGFIVSMSVPSVKAGDYDYQVYNELSSLNSNLSGLNGTLESNLSELNDTLTSINAKLAVRKYGGPMFQPGGLASIAAELEELTKVIKQK